VVPLAHAVEAGISIFGSHEPLVAASTALHDTGSLVAVNPQPLPPSVDHTVTTIAHFEVPALSGGEFAHHLAI